MGIVLASTSPLRAPYTHTQSVIDSDWFCSWCTSQVCLLLSISLAQAQSSLPNCSLPKPAPTWLLWWPFCNVDLISHHPPSKPVSGFPSCLSIRTQTPYTHRILHGLLCLSSLISFSPLHSPAHGPVAPSGASRPLSRLSPVTVVLFQAPCARFLLCGWHLLHLDVFQMTEQELIRYLGNECVLSIGLQMLRMLIESQIQTKKKLNPKPPVEDSPQINITDIEMTSPPAYNVGDMVGKLLFSLLFLIQRTLFTLISRNE